MAKKKKAKPASELTRRELYQARKEARRRRAREEKAHDEALRQARANRPRGKVLRFDAEGVRIGDDGYPMTAARFRFHHTCNAYFFFMIVVFLVAVLCIATSFFQGQQLSEWELVAYGGTMFRGFSLATLLRIEALFLLFLTACSLLANIKGMGWLYDQGSFSTVNKVIWASGVVSIVFFVVAVALVQVPEPFSVIAAVLAFLLYRFSKQVEAERPTLQKAEVAKTVVK